MTRATRLTTTDANGNNARHAIGVHLVPIRDDGKILLARRSEKLALAPGQWATVCGNLEPDESVLAAAVRELHEETGMTADPDHLQFGTVTHFVNDSYGPAVAFFFTTTSWAGDAVNKEPDKCDEIGWFDFDHLPDRTVDYVQAALADVHAGWRGGNLGFGFSLRGFVIPAPHLPATFLPRGQYIARLPKVVTAATMLLTDAEDRILLVNQTYRTDGLWSWPGGGGDPGEPPRQTARRETREELGLDLEPGLLLTVNFNHATDRPPLINYLYDGGTLTSAQIAAIRCDDEISEFAFLEPDTAERRLSASAQGELIAALAARNSGIGGIELEDGRPAQPPAQAR